jgi:O-antigen ligase
VGDRALTRVKRRIFTTALLLTLTWGVAAFGAVYPWAYWPLLAACSLLGVAGLVTARKYPRPWVFQPMLVALIALLLAISAQLVPLPRTVLQTVSPNTGRLASEFDLGYRAAESQPISVQPRATVRGLAFVAAFGLLLLGLIRRFSAFGTEHLIRGLVLVGATIAVIGIVQKAVYTGKIYGFWTPIGPAWNAFGPFVNRNHFAGWMLMAIALGLGDVIGTFSQAGRSTLAHARSRIKWLTSGEANLTALCIAGLFVMTTALVLSASRSGFLGLCLVLAIVVGRLMATRTSALSRWAVLAAAVVLLAVAARPGLDRLAGRFAEPDSLSMRWSAWQDTAAIIRDFPVAGTGWNTYGLVTLIYQKSNLQTHLAEAHSDYLQVLSEGGLLVAVPIAVLIGVFVLGARRTLRDAGANPIRSWRRVGAFAGVAALAVQELAEFSLQMPGCAMLFTVTGAVCLYEPTRSRPHA